SNRFVPELERFIARRLRLDQLRYACVALGPRADVIVGAERLRNLLGEERSERAAGDASHDLADERTEADGVIAGRRAGFPPRRLSGEQRRDLLEVEKIFEYERLCPPGQAARVRQQVPHLDALLARGGELRPVLRDRGVEIELSAVGEHQRTERRH